MDLDYTHQYAADPSSVVALMRNEEFIADVARHAGALEHNVSIGQESTRLEMKLPVPGNLSKFVGQTVSLTQIFRFQPPEVDGSVRGVVDVEVPGMPITVNAATLLSPEGAGTRGHYTGDLAVRIPLVGKKVEGLIEPFIRDAFAGLERRAAVWLAR
ncbi:DUF2505 domain-containing protein [Tessaracoccus sp. MC1679]|uniref:DUF2505 domain-containing protein n=1 Tax=Tessaracoccus sp. MC1679 TaxID=2760313 RepID=UPI0015FFCA42|nr:DUF2505 domain-containing protein [Tessaracoccus sp. MC1679]MBB1516038.1 DUF2505 domain-containing protein [Tessaracoccus sp. MC1679]